MAENERASDADDLEEGEIPSSEDEDEPKGAETANRLADDTGGDHRHNTHEEPKESRKRQRDASPELDASNRTPDQPKVRPPCSIPPTYTTHSKQHRTFNTYSTTTLYAMQSVAEVSDTRPVSCRVWD